MTASPSVSVPDTQQDRSVDDPDELGFRDRVRLVDVHHNMSERLREHEGDTGVIEDVDRGREGQKVLVKFDAEITSKIGERFVVLYKWLARLDDDESTRETADLASEATPKSGGEENNGSDDP